MSELDVFYADLLHENNESISDLYDYLTRVLSDKDSFELEEAMRDYGKDFDELEDAVKDELYNSLSGLSFINNDWDLIESVMSSYGRHEMVADYAEDEGYETIETAELAILPDAFKMKAMPFVAKVFETTLKPFIVSYELREYQSCEIIVRASSKSNAISIVSGMEPEKLDHRNNFGVKLIEAGYFKNDAILAYAAYEPIKDEKVKEESVE